jgi:hypothetical protein
MFLGDLYGQTKQAWQQFFELQSERQRDRYSGLPGTRNAQPDRAKRVRRC